jgi:hypothetical protein
MPLLYYVRCVGCFLRVIKVNYQLPDTYVCPLVLVIHPNVVTNVLRYVTHHRKAFRA